MTIPEAGAVYKKLIEIPKPPTSENPRMRFLIETFDGYPNEFCEFLGVMQCRLSKSKMRRDKVTEIMNDAALAALSIGRKDGYDDSLRHNGRPELQFLLGDKKPGFQFPLNDSP